MKIKRLDIFGFKSFVDKVSIEFETGITGIVGPNGCGKSNILDAIRWVMGEQNVRHLRGRTMEDVIFGGSESRKPTGLAEVSMIFDNSDGNCPAAYKDYAEIMVTRKLYRNGDSDYLINKTPCRLLDINELFMDTGVGARAYSIIEQGKVGALVSAKPEERRSLIEEAAGVTKFKSRKKTAVRKMDATRQNLVRLGDIISEVRRQMSNLQRQANKAEKFRELRRESRQIELALSGNRLRSLDDEIALLQHQETQDAETLNRLDGRLEEGELRLEEQQLQLTAAENSYHQSQQQDYQLGADIQRLESELSLVKRQQEQAVQQEHQARGEIDQCDERAQELEKEAAELALEQQQSTSNLTDLQARIADAEATLNQALEQDRQVHQRFERCRQALMEQFAQSSRLQNRREEIERRLGAEKQRQKHLQDELTQIDQRRNDLDQQVEQLGRQQAEVRGQEELLRRQQEGLLEELQVNKNSVEQEHARVDGCRKNLDQARSRYDSLMELQRNREGCGEGTRALLSAAQGRRIIADLLRVDALYELAVESALGEGLQAIPLDTREELRSGFDLLREQQIRGLMLLTTSDHGIIDYAPATPLFNLIAPVVGAETIVRQLLNGVFLVDAVVDHLDALLPDGVTLVDCNGARLDWRGVFSGGSLEATESGLLRRQRLLDDLSVSISDLEKEMATRQGDLELVQDRLLETEEMLVRIQGDIHRLELSSLELGKDRQTLVGEQETLSRRHQLLVFDLGQMNEVGQDLIEEMKQCDSGREAALEQQRQLEQQQEFEQQQLNLIRKEVDSCRETMTGYRVSLASSQQQLQAVTQTLERIARQQTELTERRERLAQRLLQYADVQKEMQLKEDQIRADLDARLDGRQQQLQQTSRLQEVYQELRAGLEEHRDQLRRLRADAEETRKAVARVQLRQREKQLEAEHLYANVQERYAVDLRVHQVPEATEDELERQRQQLQRLQQKIADLGEVNLMAIEEFQELEKRYDFLTGQRDDLKEALDDLEKAIAQINRTTRRRFKETFDQANEMFRQVFPRLFRGGQAELRLTDENDLLETGIDIIVQPPGKRLQNVNLLSGGEKALTAVALIFSLFLLKPTPFCVLDEVDAPLDDANIDRFAEMVREMTDRSQFILITHSKRTMSIVDTLYGVTMQEPGVSRLVSVRINDFVPVTQVGTAFVGAET